MSLILEALRKSEAERRRGETPTLLSPINEFASHALRRAERRQRRWMWLALALIVLLVAVGGYGWQQAVTTDTDSPASAANAGISEPDVVADLPQTAMPMPASPLHDAHPASVNETLPATSSPAPTTNIARADSVPQEIPAAAPTAVTKPPAMASGTTNAIGKRVGGNADRARRRYQPGSGSINCPPPSARHCRRSRSACTSIPPTPPSARY